MMFKILPRSQVEQKVCDFIVENKLASSSSSVNSTQTYQGASIGLFCVNFMVEEDAGNE
jgi:hypothetical protein